METDKDKTNEATNTEQDKTTSTTATQTDAGTGGNSAQEQDSGAMVNMSQEAFNALIADRVRRAKTAATSETLELLEVENLDQAKSVLIAHKEAQAAQMTELEKSQAANVSLQESLAKRDAAHNSVLIENAVMLAAPTHEVPANRLEALLKLMDKSTLKVENGVVSGVEDAIKKAVEANPFILFKDEGDEGDKGRLGAQGTSTSTNNKAMQDALKKAAKETSKPKKSQFRM